MPLVRGHNIIHPTLHALKVLTLMASLSHPSFWQPNTSANAPSPILVRVALILSTQMERRQDQLPGKGQTACPPLILPGAQSLHANEQKVRWLWTRAFHASSMYLHISCKHWDSTFFFDHLCEYPIHLRLSEEACHRNRLHLLTHGQDFFSFRQGVRVYWGDVFLRR